MRVHIYMFRASRSLADTVYARLLIGIALRIRLLSVLVCPPLRRLPDDSSPADAPGRKCHALVSPHLPFRFLIVSLLHSFSPFLRMLFLPLFL